MLLRIWSCCGHKNYSFKKEIIYNFLLGNNIVEASEEENFVQGGPLSIPKSPLFFFFLQKIPSKTMGQPERVTCIVKSNHHDIDMLHCHQQTRPIVLRSASISKYMEFIHISTMPLISYSKSLQGSWKVCVKSDKI